MGRLMRHLAMPLLFLVLLWPSTGNAETHALGFRARLDTYFTSNFYHAPKRRLGEFETDTGTGQRFHDMRGPGDVVSSIGLTGRWRYRYARKKHLTTRIDAEYVRPAFNILAQYFKASAQMSGDVTRRDRVRLGGSFIPNHFRKNYREPVAGGVFIPAEVLEWSALADYRHRFSKRVSAGGRYDLRMRTYNAPLANRDRQAHLGTAYVKLRFGKRIDVGGSGAAGFAISPGGDEDGAIVDRSFQVFRGRTRIDFNLPRRWDVGVDAEIRARRYTTTEATDLTRFGRNDLRWRAGIDVHKGLGKSVYLVANAAYLDSRSNREDPSLDADEAGYEEIVAGLGFGVRF